MSQPRLVFPLCRLTPFTQMMDQCRCQLPSQGWNNSDPCPITPLTFIRTSRHDRPSLKGRWKTGLCSCRYNIIVLLQHFRVHRWRIKSQDSFHSCHHSHTDKRTPLHLFLYVYFQTRHRNYWRSSQTGSLSRCQISTTTCLTFLTMKAACTPLCRLVWAAREVRSVCAHCTPYKNNVFFSFREIMHDRSTQMW